MAKQIGINQYEFEKNDTWWGQAGSLLGDPSEWEWLVQINGFEGTPESTPIGQQFGTTQEAADKLREPLVTVKGAPTVKYFGRLAVSTTPKLYAAWSWTNEDETDHYEYKWEYTMAETGDTWWTKSSGQTEDMECLCDIPEEAVTIRFKVKAVAKTDSNGKEKWTSKWSDYKKYNNSSTPPATPSGSPEIVPDQDDPFRITVELNGVDTKAMRATAVQFQLVLNDTTTYATSPVCTINTDYSFVSWDCDKRLSEGGTFKVRCRSTRNNMYSDWSSYSSEYITPPPKPETFTVCKAKSQTASGSISIYLEWAAVAGATSYDIEYARELNHFDISDQVMTLVDGHTQTQYEAFSLYDGNNGGTYYFRLRAAKGDYKSDWSEAKELVIGEPPERPTTWSSSAVVGVDEPLTLYWVHNSADGSAQTRASIYLRLQRYGTDAILASTTIDKVYPTDVEPESVYSFNLAEYLAENYSEYYKSGIRVAWGVQTAGATGEMSDWSITRFVDIHIPPTLEVTLKDATNIVLDTGVVHSFPLTVSTVTGKNYVPVGFHVTISSVNFYETIDTVGNKKTVNAGEAVYSKYFDQPYDLDKVSISAGDVDLSNGQDYIFSVIIVANSGLTTENSIRFSVSWVEEVYEPDAVITYDPERYIAQIMPHCYAVSESCFAVKYDSRKDTFTTTTTVVNPYSKVPYRKRYTLDGYLVQNELQGNTLVYYYITNHGTRVELGDTPTKNVNVYTTTGERVYYGTINNEKVYFYIATSTTPVPGVRLAVYRREFDGSFTEIAKDIDNTKNTSVTDPHPSLDYARYRIVATSETTGAVSFYDMPAYPIMEKAAIIQWDEDWSSFDVAGDSSRSQPAWSGSLLRLPYNIDVSDSYDMDVSHVEYIGRKRPVAYYGTQLGESSTWSVEIAKNDEESLYSLRRLAIWPGNVYVREPSGTGYWATVTPSFSQRHKELTIPVSITIKRVEGGA